MKKQAKKKSTANNVSPQTNVPFMKKVQEDSKIVVGSSGGKSLDGLESSMKNEATFVEFDRIYKPYVLHILNNVYHFKDTTTHTAEDIYHDVLVDLLGGLLWKFDFDRENVGQGAFRCYLKTLIRSAYFRQVLPDLIPELDKNGDPIYLDEFEKDKKGRIKEDEDGNPIRKRKMISRKEFLGEQAVQAKVDGLPSAFANQKPHEGLSKPVVRLAIAAYINAIYEKETKGKAKWRADAMKSIFEDLRDPQEVSEELQKKHIITDRRAFDTAKSIFMDEWEAARYVVQEPVIETTVNGTPVTVRHTKSGKAVVEAPEVKDENGKKCQSKEVRRRLKVDPDKLESYIQSQELAAKNLVGAERAENIGKSVVRAMLMLMQEADEKEAEKRAKYFC